MADNLFLKPDVLKLAVKAWLADQGRPEVTFEVLRRHTLETGEQIPDGFRLWVYGPDGLAFFSTGFPEDPTSLPMLEAYLKIVLASLDDEIARRISSRSIVKR